MVHRFGANRFKRFCFKMFSWVLVVSTYVEIFFRREHLNRLINVNLLHCGKWSYKGFIFMTLIIVSVLSAIFLPLGDQKKISETHTKYFVKRICQSCQIFRIFFVSNRHIWTIGSNKCPKYSFLHSFTIVSDLCMIASVVTSQFSFQKTLVLWVLSSIQTIY